MEALSDKKFWDAIDGVGKKLASYAALLALFVTVASFFITFMTFDVWGISLAAAITPSDIIVGATEALQALLPILVLLYLAATCAKWLPQKVVAWEKFDGVLALLIVVYLVSFGFGRVTYYSGFSAAISLSKSMYSALFYSFAFAILVASIALVKDHATKRTGIIVISCIGLIMVLQLARFAENRYGKLQIAGVSENCNSNEYVVWAGSRSLVTSCSPPPHRRGVQYFIIDREGIRMQAKTELRIMGI